MTDQQVDGPREASVGRCLWPAAYAPPVSQRHILVLLFCENVREWGESGHTAVIAASVSVGVVALAVAAFVYSRS